MLPETWIRRPISQAITLIGGARLLLTISVGSIFLTGCASNVEIFLEDVFEVATIESHYEPVANITIGERAGESGYWFASIRADADLVRIIDSQHMAFLYYRLNSCDNNNVYRELYLGEVYVNTYENSLPGEFIYYAAIPFDFRTASQIYTGARSYQINQDSRGLCISLGAGNMWGQYLSTNYLSINLE